MMENNAGTTTTTTTMEREKCVFLLLLSSEPKIIWEGEKEKQKDISCWIFKRNAYLPQSAYQV